MTVPPARLRPWIVWGAGLLAYIVAVLSRTTFGVSGLVAADRFDVAPSLLSLFVVLQVAVYAAGQIPAGLLLDRFGSRALLASGAAVMSAGQLALAFTESLPTALLARTVVGLGDALTFISVIRLVPHWFPDRRVPLVTQLTLIGGQFGQVLSAVPFLALLTASGWTTAYVSAAALGVLAVTLVLARLRDTPDGPATATTAPTLRETVTRVKMVWRHPGTRLGFFTHMGAQSSIVVFALMWGVPYLTVAHGVSSEVSGMLLTTTVFTTVVSGVLIGIFTGRYPHRRSHLVLAVIASNALAWTVVLALPGPAPLWLLAGLVVVIAVGGPASAVGFDFARSFNPGDVLGTAQAVVNTGGYLAALLVMQAMGMVIGAGGGYSFGSFRLAWTVQYAVWLVAIVGIVINRAKVLRGGASGVV